MQFTEDAEILQISDINCVIILIFDLVADINGTLMSVKGFVRIDLLIALLTQRLITN